MGRGSKQEGGEVLKQTGLELPCSFFHFASGGIESFKSFPEDDVSWRSCEGSGFHKEKPQDWRLRSREIWVSGSLKPHHLCSLESDAGLLRCPSPLHVS